MKRTPVFLTLTAIVALIACACAGLKARENVLLPTMRSSWPPIAALVERGVSTYPAAQTELVLTESAKMTDALNKESIIDLRQVNWLALQTAAVNGIQVRLNADEIGPGVAQSFAENVLRFAEAFDQVTKVNQ